VRAIFIIGACAAASACAPDPESRPRISSSDSVWHAYCVHTPNKLHKACYGPGWEANRPKNPKHYDFYEISVERINSETSSSVLFSRRLMTSEVHSELLTETSKEVVRYDASTGEFVFHVSRYPVVYQLHER
jgi:hypothetical protein